VPEVELRLETCDVQKLTSPIAPNRHSLFPEAVRVRRAHKMRAIPSLQTRHLCKASTFTRTRSRWRVPIIDPVGKAQMTVAPNAEHRVARPRRRSTPVHHHSTGTDVNHGSTLVLEHTPSTSISANIWPSSSSVSMSLSSKYIAHMSADAHATALMPLH
jgi:hypothetical protein